MTERLNQLLHAEVDRLDVPLPDPGAALAQGRRLRRRRRAAMVGAAAVVLTLVGGTALVVGNGDDDRALQPAGSSPDGLAFAIGNNVYVEDAAVRATIDDTSVKSLYYTSAGVLVRHGNNPDSDGGGPQRFSLVTPDGAVKPVSVVTEETVHSADPAQPYLAFAEKNGDVTEVVVWNVETDSEEARVALPDGLRWGGWSAPPVSLSGDDVYVGTEDVALVVDWRSGSVTETDAIPPGFPQVFGGRAEGDGRVVDATTGETLLQVDGQDTYLSLSPDGRFAMANTYDGDRPVTVYDVASGAHVDIEPASRGYGWSPDGELFTVDGHELTTCSPATGECATSDVELVEEPRDSEGVMTKCDASGKCTPVGPPPDYSGELRLGGMTYES
jgi:hypothetical protein